LQALSEHKTAIAKASLGVSASGFNPFLLLFLLFSFLFSARQRLYQVGVGGMRRDEPNQIENSGPGARTRECRPGVSRGRIAGGSFTRCGDGGSGSSSS
jgi:hypothetical protein